VLPSALACRLTGDIWLDGVALELNERGIHAYGLVRVVPQ
jgi:hypothetical protein